MPASTNAKPNRKRAERFMKFNLYATFRLLAKTKTVSIDLPGGTTVRQAVNEMIEHLPVLRPHWMDEAGELYAHVHIFIDGQDAQNLEQGLDTPLQTNSVLDFFPPVGGGSFLGGTL